MAKLLSIVIPTYNMEKYLRKCLTSLVVPEDKMDKLEVLVINDGSKDSSSKIAHEFQDKYPQTFKVVDKENGNYGSCVNRGLKEYTGKYIKVLDADDSFDNEALEEFLDKLLSIDVDMVITDFDKVDPEGNAFFFHRYDFPKAVAFNVKDIDDSRKLYGLAMHSIAYNRRVFVDLNYKQTEGISYTDQEWTFLPMTKVSTMEYLPIRVYKYLFGREGQTMNIEVVNKHISHYFKILTNRFSELSNRKLHVPGQIEDYLHYKTMVMASFVYRSVLLRKVGSLDDLINLDNMIKKTTPKLYQDLDKQKTKGPIGFKYVRYFHKHHTYAPSVIIWAYTKLYSIFKSGSEKSILR